MFNPSVTDMGSLYEEMRVIRESMESTGEAPQTMHTQEDPSIEAEDYNMEDYSKDDLEKVKSKTEDIPREVKDEELVQKPAKPSDKVTKESKNIKENMSHPLHLCNECSRTFRNSKRICLYCNSGDVLPIVHITEGILELVGEIEGVDQREQDAIRKAIDRGVISNEWPDEEEMIDALSSLEDFVNPEDGPGDLRQAYLRYMVVPKALSVLEEATGEGMKDRLNKIKSEIISLSDRELSSSMDRMIKIQAGTTGKFEREHNQEVIDFMAEEWGRRAKAARKAELEGMNEQEELIDSEPQEGDIIFSDAGRLGGQTQVSAEGKVIGTFTEEEDAIEAAKAWMEKNNFYPNVWRLSDHGNYHLISLGDMDEKKMNEQEDMPRNHSMEARRAELKAEMAEKEQAHTKEMERMAKELEGMN